LAAPTPRPRWATWLDRLARHSAAAIDKVVARPSDGLLRDLARQDRPCPPITMPDFGIGPGVEAQLREGRAAFSEGHYGDALHHFRTLTEADPKNAWGWHGRGDALQMLNAHAEALAAYDRAIDLAPERGLHHGGRANALSALDRSADADGAWSTALELDPSLSWMRR